MKTGAYCGTVALASFLLGVITSNTPVAAYYACFLLPLVTGFVGTVFEERS